MEEIFRRAAEHTAFGEGRADAIRYEDLVAAAREVGIDASAVEEVATRVEAERSALIAKAEEDQIVRASIQSRRDAGKQSLLRFVIITSFLGALDAVTPGGPWAHVLGLVYALFVALRWGRVLLFEPTQSDREAILTRESKRRARERGRRARLEAEQMRQKAREHRNQAAQAEAEALRERLEAQQRAIRGELAQRTQRADRTRQAQRQFEASVEEGVTALLQALSRQIEKAARGGTASAPIGDFGRYVEAQRGGTAPESPRVRVEPPEDAPSAPLEGAARVDRQAEADEAAGRRESERRSRR